MGFRDRLVGFVGDIIADAQEANTPSNSGQSQQSGPKTYPLNQQATVVLNSNGNGIASCGPLVVRQHWQPTAVAVSVGTNVSEAQCSIYYGTTVGSGTFLGQTATGSTGDTCGIAAIDLPPGAQIWAQWKGGDAGSTAVMVVQGQYSTGALQ
jgi:hypothetical protein